MSTPEHVKRFLERAGKTAEAPGDQSVYVYLGAVMRDHFPPNVIWTLAPEYDEHGGCQGNGLDVSLLKEDGRVMPIKHYAIGEWSWIGRAHPG